MYNSKSKKAEEFIDDQEILDTIAYAKENKENKQLLREVLEKAKTCGGLNHREAALLLECEDQEILDQLFALAREIKEKIYGRPDCDVCASLSVQLLRERMSVLPLSLQKQAYRQKETDPGGDQERSDCPAGHGPQAACRWKQGRTR